MDHPALVHGLYMHIDLMRDKAKTVPSLPGGDDITSLKIWHCKYKTLAPLAELTNLETLVIATFPDNAFNFLSKLKGLRHLSVMHLPAVTEIMALGELVNLESLSLATLPSWDPSGRRTLIDTLEPIACLRRLQHLELLGVCPQDMSLSALSKCAALRTARFAGYPKDRVAEFYSRTNVSKPFNPRP